MKTVRAVLILAICMLAAGLRTRADAFSFALDPANGAVEGPAGSTVGWGFTLTSTSADFAVITGSDFCVGAVSSPCSNTLGTYTDFTGSQFIVVGPAAGENTVSETFDNTAMNGVGSFSISPADIPAESVVGEIALFYDLFSVDPNSPNFDPTVDTVGTGYTATDAASVTVGSTSGGGGTSTPEPGTIWLILAALLAGSLLGRNRRTVFPAY
ncbi:MAG: PEP-CTERM sorting domain-containing protein [Candidatus Acidiferrum sp.]|jgi:hypothetical protein